MNSDELSSPIDSSPPATQVPPLTSKQSELSLDKQIKEGTEKLKEGTEKLNALLLLWRQCKETQQRTEDTTAKNGRAATTKLTTTTSPREQ